jgi:cation diffusion facilitator CzcD-associated flavoprotein CzcO
MPALSSTPRIAIIGAGFGGIGTAVALKKAGIHAFTIFEKAPRVGGVWWHNTYPGAEVDVSSVVYSFGFKRYDWSRTHVRQREIQSYLEETVSDWGLDAHLRCGIGVERAVWNEETHTYRLTLDNDESCNVDVLIAATGFLNIPRYPIWPGLDDFEGAKFHTARWDHSVDLTDKTVAVVGTGSSAVQIVPEIAPRAKHVFVFQREPGWVLPKNDRDLSPAERARRRNPLVYRRARWKELWRLEKGLWRGRMWKPSDPFNRQLEAVSRALIAREFADRPDLEKAVTPQYPFPGKRQVLSSSWYPTLKRDDVKLVPRAVVSVTPTGVVDSEGTERKADVLVLATGFEATNYLAGIEVVGRDGTTLRDAWAGEPQAFLGVNVPKFPNLFILYGPGTNGGNIVAMLKQQANFTRRALQRMIREGATSIEVKQSWHDVYNAWLQTTMAGTSWEVSRNYFTSASGKVVTQWVYSSNVYGAIGKALGRWSQTTRRRSTTEAIDERPLNG